MNKIFRYLAACFLLLFYLVSCSYAGLYAFQKVQVSRIAVASIAGTKTAHSDYGGLHLSRRYRPPQNLVVKIYPAALSIDIIRPDAYTASARFCAHPDRIPSHAKYCFPKPRDPPLF
jgi:hypothetical protein